MDQASRSTPKRLSEALGGGSARVAASLLSVASTGLVLSTTYLWCVLLMPGTASPSWWYSGAAGLIGCAGFLACAAVVLLGQRSLVRPSTSSRMRSWARVAGPCRALLPPMVAALVWPTFYFTGLIGWLPIVALAVHLACLAWAYSASSEVAADLCALLGWTRFRRVQNKVILVESVAILASLPLFLTALGVLHALGYRVFWH
jgi:hypothetical protein